VFYGGVLLASHPTPELEGHTLSAVRDCLFSMFAATLHIWKPSPPSATLGHGDEPSVSGATDFKLTYAVGTYAFQPP
jgi:hypothetical protein